MALFKRGLQKRAAAIDAERWEMLAPILEDGEQQLLNTPCKIVFTDSYLLGFAFLSDRAFLFAGEETPMRIIRYRGPFAYIKAVQPQEGTYNFLLAFETDEGYTNCVIELYPSPLSQEFYRELLSRVGNP